MNHEQMSKLQQSLERLQAGERNAVNEVAELALDSLHDATSRLLRSKFKSLKEHDTASVFNSSWPDLALAIQANPPKSINGLIGLACTVIRRDLLDLIRRENAPHRRHHQFDEGFEPTSEAPSSEELERWAEFHQAVGELPDEERAVFEMNYYFDMPQVDISDVLKVSPRRVSRYYQDAVQYLTEKLQEKCTSTDLLS